MVIKNKFYSAVLLALLTSYNVSAEQIDTNTAQMQAMDKITGRVNIIEVPVGGEVKFGTFSVVVRSCKTNAEGEVPENYAFVDVSDKSFDKEEFNIFKGWMISSSPAVNAVEHPIYDVWLLKCINSDMKDVTLLSEEQLAQRDKLPRLQEFVDMVKISESNTFTENEKSNITIKDSMYKESPKVKDKKEQVVEQENSGSPQNLLNISENFDEPEEEMVQIPSDELSKALKSEANSINFENKTEINNDTSSVIDDELSAAIDAELAKHNN